MNYFNQLSLIQKVILISIAGVVSIIALVGLSETYQDYYVSAALAQAFFWGILLLVLSSPFIYLARRKNNKGKAEKELEKAKRLAAEDEEKTKRALEKLEEINQSETITGWNDIPVNRHVAGSIIYKIKHKTPLDNKEENLLKSIKDKL